MELIQIHQGIIDTLSNIEGNGSFCSSGSMDLVLPGLEIKGFGEVALPLNKTEAKKLIKHAKQAPFGKGSQTVTDTSVRKAWEIDGNKISFLNKAWNKILKELTQKIQAGLGIEDKKIKLSLYKLLIYEKGGFFLPHQEKGMFGTLVVGLPSKHTGGTDFQQAQNKW